MKRIISCLLTVLLLVSIICQTSVVAAENDEPTFTVSSEQGNPGKNVDVAIRMDHNPGIASIKLKAQFDEGLILNSITYNRELGGSSQQPETFTSPVTLNWYNGAANTQGDMDYAVLHFTVAQNASVGMHGITVTYDANDVYNINERNVLFRIVNGGVNVTIPVEGLALDHKTATVATGDGTFTLTPVFTPPNATNQAVTWKSSNTAVATVSNGVVTLLKDGRAVITATSADGGFKAKCTLTVLCSHLDCEDIPAEASTCIKQGHEAYTICKDCGEIVSGSDDPLPLAEHRYINKVKPEYLKSAATCTGKAVYYKSCSVCGAKGTATFTSGSVNPDNHVGGTHIENHKDATCAEAGYTGDTVCNSCSKIITYGSVIDKLAHSPAAPVRENEVAAFCETPGGYDEVVYCSECGAQISREAKTIPATGHSYGAPEWSWKGYAGATAVFSCSKCEDKQTVTAVITSKTTKEPTLTEEGERKYTAKAIFKDKTYTDVKTEVIPRLFILGDADSNGIIEIRDTTWIQRHVARIKTPFTISKASADIDGDDDITLMDASLIQRWLAGLKSNDNIGKTKG